MKTGSSITRKTVAQTLSVCMMFGEQGRVRQAEASERYALSPVTTSITFRRLKETGIIREVPGPERGKVYEVADKNKLHRAMFNLSHFINNPGDQLPTTYSELLTMNLGDTKPVSPNWNPDFRPEKEKVRQDIIELASSSKIRMIFDLPGEDCVSSKYFKERFDDATIMGAENKPEVLRRILATYGDQFSVFAGNSSKVLKDISSMNKRPFDLVNLDYCGNYCTETREAISTLVNDDLLSHGGWLFVTLGQNQRLDEWALELVQAYIRATGVPFDGECELHAFPYKVAEICETTDYVPNLMYYRSYSDTRTKMHVFGFRMIRALSKSERLKLTYRALKSYELVRRTSNATTDEKTDVA